MAKQETTRNSDHYIKLILLGAAVLTLFLSACPMAINSELRDKLEEYVAVATPRFTPEGGTYYGRQSIEINCTTERASIRYTIDGSAPDEANGTLYSGPIYPTGNFTLRAIAYKAGWNTSGIANEAYSIIPNGSLDSSYGSDGIVITDINSEDDYAYAAAIQTDGKVVVAGGSAFSSDDDFVLARYKTDGSLDTDFGSDGKVFTDIEGLGNDDRAYAVAVLSDGRIVAAGKAGSSFALTRYTSDGSLDTTFDGDGKLSIAIGTGTSWANSVAVLPDGKTITAGYAHNGTNYDFALVRFGTDGSLDTNFGSSGIVMTDFGLGDDGIEAVAILSDDKIIAAGNAFNGTYADFALARYTSDGTPDESFGNAGTVVTSFGSTSSYGNNMAILSDGKIVVSGDADSDFALARYTADGIIDTSFGVDGKVITTVGTGYGTSNEIAIQTDGKIIAAGFVNTGVDYDCALTRYSVDGFLDTDFGTGGIVTTAIGSGTYDYFYSTVIQSDGKIVGIGYSNYGADYNFILLRYFP